MRDGSSLSHEESLRFRGLARVDLKTLNFDHALFKDHRKPLAKNISRLVRVFRQEGCNRSDESNFVKAQVNHRHLDAALASQNLTLPQQPPKSWKTIPILNLQSVDCLNGLYRVLAAREFLNKNDRWWIARLYTDDLPVKCSRSIAEEYKNENAFADGEIIRKIRQYHLAGDDDSEQRWWARLSNNKRDELRKLLKNKQFKRAFDAMLPWPGLWQPVRLGALRRINRIKCPEESLNCLHLIVHAWSDILAGTGDNFPAEAVDAVTVRKLETLSPKTSTRDAELVTRMMDDLSLFPQVRDDADRMVIHSNLLECRMIPSLFTFIENLKTLEPCAQILRELLPPKHGPSVYQSLWASYSQPTKLYVEYAVDDIRPHPSSSAECDFEIGYQQLWLYAMRNFPAMTRATLRQGGSEGQSGTQYSTGNDPRVWQRFGALAVSLGFRTEEVECLAAQDGEHELAAQLVNRTEIGDVAAGEVTQRIATILRHAQQQSSGFAAAASKPRYATFGGDEWLPSERRCGKPFDEDHDLDRGSLFLPMMYVTPGQPSENVSTLYCKWEMFRGFFGLHKMPTMTFNAAIASCDKTPLPASPSNADPGSTLLGRDCLKCKETEEQISAHKRTVDELRKENERSREASRVLEVQIAALRDSAETDQRAADVTADQIRAERDTLQARLARLEQVSTPRRALSGSRRDAEAIPKIQAEKHALDVEVTALNARLQEALGEAIPKIQAEKDALDVEVTGLNARLQEALGEAIPKIQTEKDALDVEVIGLNARLQEALGDLTKSRETDGQLRSQLLHLENEARELKAKASGVEEEMSGLRHQLAQRTQEFESQSQKTSATLAQKDGAIQTLEANLDRSSAELNAAIQKAQDLQERLDAQVATTHMIQAELDQLRKEGAEKDAANDNLDDRRYDAEIALANDRRTFQIVQQGLVERSQEAEARSQYNENLLTESLAQMASERENYRLTLSVKPEADFLLLRVVTCEGTQVRMRDRILSPSGADELLEQLQKVNHDLSQYIFLIGMWRQVLTPGNTTYSSVREAWRQRQVLWVFPVASYTEIRRSWAGRFDWYTMDELERKGFTPDSRGARLVYSDPVARQGAKEQRKRKRTTQWPGVRNRSRSPRREDRSRSPRREDRARSPIRSRSRVRGRADSARRSPSAGAQDATDSASSALQLVGSLQVSGRMADLVNNEESMQTVERIEDVMENE